MFSAIAAIGNSKDGDSGLAFGALFGAGVFVSTVIVGIICLIKPFQSVKVYKNFILRGILNFWIDYINHINCIDCEVFEDEIFWNWFYLYD